MGATDHDDNSALHYAAAYGSLGSLKVLVQHGANCRKSNKDNITALQGAALRGWTHLVDYIVENIYFKFHEVDLLHS